MDWHPIVLLLEPSFDDASLLIMAAREADLKIRVQVAISLPEAIDLLLESEGLGTGGYPDLIIIIGGRTSTLRRELVIRELRKVRRWRPIAMMVLSDTDEACLDGVFYELGVIGFMRRPNDWAGYVRLALELEQHFRSMALSRGTREQQVSAVRIESAEMLGPPASG